MKKFFSVLLAVCLLMSLGITAYADKTSLDGGVVSFDGTELKTNYSTADYEDAIGAMQPGDTTVITITQSNECDKSTDWWMTNDVLQSFEDSTSASGGAYTYTLTYSGPGGTTVLFNNTVGGDKNDSVSETGLHQATTATAEDYLYLDTLKKGDTGTVTLTVKLDGETQGNTYQGAQGKLSIDFAVELTKKNVVRTGDDTQIMPYLIASTVSGVVLLAVAIILIQKNSRKRRGGHVK